MNSSLHSLNGAHSPTRPTPQQLRTGLALGGGAGAFVALISFLGMGGWYASLVKPLWAPSAWTFVLMQLLACVFMGAALAYLWASRAPDARKRVVSGWFWAQLALGLLWVLCFFTLHSAGLGYTVIMLWWCAVVALLWTGSRLSRTAFWLLVPLFAWVTFASSLNFAILSFNVLRQTSAQMDADPTNRDSPANPPIIVKKK
jgi:benzodiazapine receptor